MIIDIISQIRGVKTSNSVSLKTPIKDLELSLNKELKAAINCAIKDFKATLFIQNLSLKEVPKDYKVDMLKLQLGDDK